MTRQKEGNTIMKHPMMMAVMALLASAGFAATTTEEAVPSVQAEKAELSVPGE